jgi:hypothetical protein
VEKKAAMYYNCGSLGYIVRENQQRKLLEIDIMGKPIGRSKSTAARNLRAQKAPER